MIAIGIIILILIVIHYKRKKAKEEQMRAENIMQNSTISTVEDSPSISNAANPFIDNNTNVNQNTNLNSNPFISNEGTTNGFTIPICPINNSNINHSKKEYLGEIYSDYTNHYLYSYKHNGQKLLLIQSRGKVLEQDYQWLRLVSDSMEKYPDIDFNQFDNVRAITTRLPEGNWDAFIIKNMLETEMKHPVESLELVDNEGNKTDYWVLGVIEYQSVKYVVLYPKNYFVDELIIKMVETQENGQAFYSTVTDENIVNKVLESFEAIYSNEQ